MPVELKKAYRASQFHFDEEMKFIHARPIATVAEVSLCGLCEEEYATKLTNKRITCISCLQLLTAS